MLLGCPMKQLSRPQSDHHDCGDGGDGLTSTTWAMVKSPSIKPSSPSMRTPYCAHIPFKGSLTMTPVAVSKNQGHQFIETPIHSVAAVRQGRMAS